MQYIYETENICATQIKLEIDGDIITNIDFVGGCNGNLKTIPMLIDGWKVDKIEDKLAGITCGRKPTSCADQLAKAVREAYSNSIINRR